ncbi:translocation protein S66, partial [Coelomomyces lativittatus]
MMTPWFYYYVKCLVVHPSRLSTPWFSTPHVTKEAYVTYYDGIDNDPLTQDQIKQLKTLLMRRTMTNVERVFALREDRTALSLLVSQGSIGDHLWHEFLEAEHEIDQEISSCVQEAELLQPGWSKLIFPQAAQLIAREREKEAAE